MTQYLADRYQPCPLPEQLSSKGMPQPMRPHPWQLSSSAGSMDSVSDQPRADRSAGSPAGKEQMTVTVGTSSVQGQVGDQGLADLGWQRQAVLAAGLAADDDFSRPPVHVRKLQPSDLDRPQTEPGDQHHDREVAGT